MGKSGLAIMILNKANKAKADKEPEKDTQDNEDAALESAMDDLITAIHAKDSEAAVEAWKSLMELC